jgi:hypothetical protein
MANTYHIGDQPTVTTTFETAAGVATTPSAYTAFVQRPDGTETTLTPVPGATGVLVTTLPVLDQDGRWRWRVEATAGIVAADEGLFFVRASTFTP